MKTKNGKSDICAVKQTKIKVQILSKQDFSALIPQKIAKYQPTTSEYTLQKITLL